MDSSIAIVGAGRVGSAFAIALRKLGAPLVALASRDRARAQSIATLVGGFEGVAISDLGAGRVGRVLIAVSDDAIGAVARDLSETGFAGGAALHTSGCRGPEVLAPLAAAGVSVGAIHPLQTFPTAELGAARLPGSTFAIGGEGDALEWAQQMVDLFSGKALRIRPEHWALYHAAAVIASNYHATIVDAALECLEAAGVSREDGLNALAPLLEGTLRAILRMGPQAALTGPISRGDLESVRRNRESLHLASPATREVYDSLARRTVEIMKRRGMTAELGEQWKQLLL